MCDTRGGVGCLRRAGAGGFAGFGASAVSLPCACVVRAGLAPCLHGHPAQGVSGSRCKRFLPLSDGAVTARHTWLMAVL
jgi:hypothetical protein